MGFNLIELIDFFRLHVSVSFKQFNLSIIFSNFFSWRNKLR